MSSQIRKLCVPVRKSQVENEKLTQHPAQTRPASLRIRKVLPRLNLCPGQGPAALSTWYQYQCFPGWG